MTRRLAAALAAIFTLAVLAAGCGSSSSSSSSTGTNGGSNEPTTTMAKPIAEADKGKEADKGERKKSSCKAPAAAKTGLPSSFPSPAKLTITGSAKEGPTTIAQGYWSGGLDGAYVALKAAVTGAGYQLGHTEKDEHDSEIEYEGGGREGQIALRETCTEQGLLRVRISSRPK
jgi:hypothetical protein